MRKSLLFALLVLFTAYNLSGQNAGTIFKETFDSDNLPTGWSIVDEGASNWMIGKSNNSGGAPNELQFGWTPPYEGTTRVIYSSINLTGITSATISLKHNVDVYENSAEAGGTIGIATSSNNGSTWNTAWSKHYSSDGTYEVSEVFNSPDLGKDNVMLCIFFEGSSYNINFWYFDDLYINSQNQIDISLTSINNQDYVLLGENEISFSVQNMGEVNIDFFEASYKINNETVTESFTTDLSPMESESFSFETIQHLELGNYELDIEIISANGTADENAANNTLNKEIVVASGLTQKIPMIEHFSSSTCGPCVEVNSIMHELTEANPGKYTYVKYAMDWPAMGDPYYNGDGAMKKTFYNVSAVPSIFIDGATSINGIITQEDIDNIINEPTIANIRGSFSTDGSTINIIADFMSYIDLQDVSAFISINEKTTTGNVGSNGETEFHHIMMKMLDNADGNELNINAYEYQRFEFSYDMSLTKMEDINDLEVALWIQDKESKEIVNSRFAYEYCEHVYPAQNLKLEPNNNTLVISWEAPQEGEPSGYDIYINNTLTANNINDLSHSIAITESGIKTVEVVARYDEKTSVGLFNLIDLSVDIEENEFENISIYPNPAKDFVKVTNGKSQMAKVKVYNCLGMMIEEIEVNTNEIEINTSDYKPGVYFINIQTENGSVIEKVMK
ncbi:MAG: T9SS type A sorting domain-containing protein [Bacteroidales bacterium]|nr:T9SS type A sorting domain-containing protein [Bacteroidales bacterium]